jgi:hypothetical protein
LFLAINNQHVNILGIIPPSESDTFIDYGVKGKIAGYGQLVPYKVSTEEEFHSMHFSLIVLEAADDWNDDSASVDLFNG